MFDFKLEEIKSGEESEPGSSGQLDPLFWIYIILAVIAGMMMGHAGKIGLIAGSIVFFGLIVVGVWRTSSLFVAAILSVYPMDSVPAAAGLREIVFVTAMTALFLKVFWSFRGQVAGILRKPVVLLIAVLVVALLVNLLIALNNGVSLQEWARGLIPFLFILVSFPVAFALSGSPDHLRPLALSFFILSLLFSLRILIVYFQLDLWMPVETGVIDDGAVEENIYKIYRRVTHVLPQSTSVLVLLSVIWGGCGFLILKGKGRTLAMVGACLGTSAVILTHTRSMMLTVIAVLVCMGVHVLLFRRKKLKAFFALVGTLCAVSILTVQLAGLGEVLFERFGSLVSSGKSGEYGEDEMGRYKMADVNVTARLEEYRIAWGMFLEEPIAGKGLGVKHKMRFDVGAGEFLEQEVGYVHNWVLYFLSVGGVLGILAYIWIVVTPLQLLLRHQYLRSDLGLIVYASIGGLICYGLFFAVFRLIPFNLILGSLVGIGLAIGAGRRKFQLCAESLES